MRPNKLCVPCTKTTDERCQLLQHREAINEGLLGAGLELCEDVRQVGGIRLAVTQISACQFPFWAQTDDQMRSSAFKLANDLLTCHSRCFTALEVYSGACCTCRVRDALSKGGALKSLTVYSPSQRFRLLRKDADVFSLIDSLSSLDELVFKTETGSLNSTVQIFGGRLPARAPRNLTTLDVSRLEWNPECVAQFVWALIANRTVADLAVGGRVYRASFQMVPGELFAHYLIKSAAILKKLTLSDGPTCDDLVLWKTLIPALCKTTSLEELNLDLTIGYEISTEVTALFSQVVLHCPTLRLLQLPRPGQTRRGQFLNDGPNARHKVVHWMKAWLKALRTTTSLHELRLNLPDMNEIMCRALLQAVDNNKTLKKVVFQEVPLIANSKDSSNLMVLSRTINELSLGDRVHLMNLSVSFGNAPKILASTELCTMNFDNLCIEFSAEHDVEPLKACCEVLFRRGISTSFKICCDSMTQAAFDTLLNWLATSSTLTHVEIVNEKASAMAGFNCGCIYIYDRVVSALARNANIARIRLVGIHVKLEHLDMLWDCAYNHRNLVGINLVPQCYNIYPCIKKHRNLQSKKFCRTALKLQELMRKNADRISAAAGFVLGEEIRKGARVIEVQHNHPWLLELVRERASVTDAEAEAMVQRAMRMVRDCSLRDYMRLTGVVKENVEHLDTDSKGFQLADLNADCWLHVRRYLKITDVVIPRGVKSATGPPGPCTP
ncbi:uncharacterized protein LOC142589712 [Dermacentor variabilis]|uniref:uncharacterized protein LOC142589712 n=1 Tax=Dermacentor variabilis TaxID=34621 RepID=UPI003F5BC832